MIKLKLKNYNMIFIYKQKNISALSSAEEILPSDQSRIIE